MFRCGKCQELSGPGKPQTKVVVETRDKSYKFRDSEGKPAVSHGSEIVKEISICETCRQERASA